MALTRGRDAGPVWDHRKRWRKVVEAIPKPPTSLANASKGGRDPQAGTRVREHEGLPAHCRGCGERVYLGASCGRGEDADGERHQCR